ncbi:MAG: trypsin-like peptidase domain-containing protein [Nitrososphaeraceae archaeon]
MEHNIKKVTVLLLSIVGAAVIIVSSTTALPSSPLHSIMAQQQQQQNVVQSSSSSSSINPLTSTSSSSPSSSSSSSSLANVFKRVENSVVQITSTRSDPNQVTIINGVPATGRSTALGSGFVYDNQGHIITNHHVIDGATTADVTFTDGNTYSAKVIGKDPDADIAVLQITDNFSEEKVMPLPVANSSSLRPGDQLIAIGNPFGLSGTITTGIVSGEGRLLPNPDTGFSIPNIIQTDAPINPGNSGGPLLNIQGQVIGMNTAILSRTGSYSGVGFAIPSNAIAKEVPVLIKGGTYAHPWLGISGGKITPDIAQSAGLPRNYKGVVVGSVQPGSPADKAGTQALTQDMAGSNTHIGDIITSIDGHPTRQIDDIINYVDSNKNVGDNVKLTINRNGQTTDVTATLQARPDTISQQQQQQQQQPQQPQQPGLGPIPGFPQLPPELAPLLP